MYGVTGAPISHSHSPYHYHADSSETSVFPEGEPDRWTGGAMIRHDWYEYIYGLRPEESYGQETTLRLLAILPSNLFLGSCRNLEDSSQSSLYLEVTPLSLTSTRTPAQVNWKWSGMPPHDVSRDWIGVYSPSHSADGDFTDYQLVKNTSYSVLTGQGSLDMSLMNLRADVEFRYWHYISNSSLNEPDRYCLAQTSSRVCITEDVADMPTQVHLALTQDATEMLVQWTSNSSQVVSGGVQYRISASPNTPNSQRELRGELSPSVLWANVTNSYTYSPSDMCGAPANLTAARFWRFPGFFHTAIMSGLEPGVRYEYRVGDYSAGWSEWFHFTSPDPRKTEMRGIVFGDLGESVYGDYLLAQVADDCQSTPTDVVLHVGDISYALGRTYVWDDFMYSMENVSAFVPYMVATGNHEYDYDGDVSKDPTGATARFNPPNATYDTNDSNNECGVALMARFTMPDDGNKLWWYSFDSGPVHFITISAEHDFLPGSVQYNWLEVNLAAANKEEQRSRIPWIIVNTHRPLYMAQDGGAGDNNVEIIMRDALEELFHSYQVDILFTGHWHSYGRSCEVYKEKCTAPDKGTVHLVIGAASYMVHDEWLEAPWSAAHHNDIGYGRFYANLSTLSFELVESKSAAVVDSFVLRKQYDEEVDQTMQWTRVGVFITVVGVAVALVWVTFLAYLGVRSYQEKRIKLSLQPEKRIVQTKGKWLLVPSSEEYDGVEKETCRKSLI